MTYRLPRIMHWLQNNNLSHYATHILRQLYNNPLSEYLILNFITLSKTDKLANLVQFISMILSVIGVSYIAKYLGASKKGQLYSAFIAITVPMGIIQAPDCQNDYIVTFFMTSFVLSGLLLLNNNLSKPKTNLYEFICAISLGLSVLTKGTAYFFMFPFGCLLVILYFYKKKKKSLLLITLLILIPLCINGPQYYRNYNTFNNIIAPEDHIEEYYSVKHLTLKGFISSTIRNTFLHIQLPDENLRIHIQKSIEDIHKSINYPINHPDTTIGGHYRHPKFMLKGIEINDHFTGNTLHLLLIVISFLLFIIPSIRKENKKVLIYSLVVLSGYLMFCLLVKWQPFGTRLHLGIFILFSPLISILLTYIEKIKMNLLGCLIVILIFLNALPYILLSQFRPLIGEYNVFTTPKYPQYYANMRHLQQHQLSGFETLFYLNKTSIGLVLWMDEYEYPIWARLHEMKKKFKIQHVNVNNISKKYKNDNVDVILDFSHL
ncbi:MAG: glycosyltransferase family 39 protein [Vampirovibrionia bacterium]